MKINHPMLQELFERPSKTLFEDMMHRNLSNVRIVSTIVAFLALCLLANYLIFTPTYVIEKTDSFAILLLCIFSSVAVSIHMFAIHRHPEELKRMLPRETFIVCIYFIALEVWAIYISVQQYIDNAQAFNFYIVQILFVSYITLPPLTSALMVFSGYSVFYYFLYMVDQAARFNHAYFWMMAFLCWLGMWRRYYHDCMQVNANRAIEELNDQLLKLSYQDTLTRTNNRASFRATFDRSIHSRITLSMIDVDNFKHFNDVYGHIMGDNVLKAIADSLKSVFGYEAVYRYGGDEFMVVLEDVDKEEVQRLQNLWFKKVSDIHISGLPETISCSIGSAYGLPNNSFEMRNLIDQADRNLYLMKEHHHQGDA